MCLVFKQVFYLAEEAFTLLIVLFVGILFKFLQKLFLALAQVFRHFNGYAHVLVTASSAVDALNTLALELEHIARLRTLVHGVAHLAVERRHRDFRAECSLRERDWHIAPNVVAAARENGMWTNCNVYVQVAVRTAVGAGIAPVSYTHLDVYKRQI